ncbi:alpha-ketoglutarate-dependent taurine dioxygenase [Talaromyces proteolyticus]|uniref:Alpha-ketoglutarate-dependent taurine dioxygenase n=1 Tax=Talaromyces proteolyticus TaxID=1131652 RepID=A0AAD4KXU8_9EURO|nr:alpha-ketoglutarate-dependent taurine dioxygenase [Talaromyces proteolyticus]KAH8703555.1 alpha-ketoglutarate-dependent taurine dioxygenase [Talaromyces proteolyticus]
MSPSVDLTNVNGNGVAIPLLPEISRQRMEKAGIDLSNGYPQKPDRHIQQAPSGRDHSQPYIDAGSRADKEKSNLLSAAKEVIHLSKHIGTELTGLQLKDLSNQQRDELALLIAERGVVFFRDQDISPQQQHELAEYYGEPEVHPVAPHVPGVPSASVIWPDFQATECEASFRRPGGVSGWHTDLALGHDKRPAGISHLHNDAVPSIGGDTLWSSGYCAYEKLSPSFRKFIDGKKVIYRSAVAFIDSRNPAAGPTHVVREYPLVRTHPATGWRSLWVNRAMAERIVGLDKSESDLILNYLCDLYEKSVDIQVRFRWTPKTSALWDNRVTIHVASWDYEGSEPRHGTRATALAEQPYFDPKSPTRREALRLLGASEIRELEEQGIFSTS